MIAGRQEIDRRPTPDVERAKRASCYRREAENADAPEKPRRPYFGSGQNVNRSIENRHRHEPTTSLPRCRRSLRVSRIYSISNASAPHRFPSRTPMAREAELARLPPRTAHRKIPSQRAQEGAPAHSARIGMVLCHTPRGKRHIEAITAGSAEGCDAHATGKRGAARSSFTTHSRSVQIAYLNAPWRPAHGEVGI